jgi:hypothetical protein
LRDEADVKRSRAVEDPRQNKLANDSNGVARPEELSAGFARNPNIAFIRDSGATAASRTLLEPARSLQTEEKRRGIILLMAEYDSSSLVPSPRRSVGLAEIADDENIAVAQEVFSAQQQTTQYQ